MQSGGVFNISFINSHLWYISVLLICYALFFIIIYLAKRMAINWRYGCYFMVILGTSVLSSGWDYPFLNYQMAHGSMSFFTGLLLAGSMVRIIKKHGLVILSVFIVVISTLIFVFKYDLIEYGIRYYMAFIYFPALIVSCESSPVQKVLSFRFLGTVSQISFDFFIWHFELITFCAIVNDLFKLGINFSARMTELVVLLLCIVVAVASYYLLDRPINRFANKKMFRSETDKDDKRES